MRNKERNSQETAKMQERMLAEQKKTGEADVYTNLYENRELSWLRFNERVLEEAQDKKRSIMRKNVISFYFSKQSG